MIFMNPGFHRRRRHLGDPYQRRHGRHPVVPGGVLVQELLEDRTRSGHGVGVAATVGVVDLGDPTADFHLRPVGDDLKGFQSTKIFPSISVSFQRSRSTSVAFPSSS